MEFRICRRTGWSYWDVVNLPRDVYALLVENLSLDKQSHDRIWP
jgi:hypothetical protein